jgi:octaprenyl-diphosphate synthase
VSDDLVRAEQALHSLLGETIPAVAAIGRYLAESGGKRLRPMLTALGAKAAGNSRDITRLMCAGEMLHLGSLLHDDVVDDGIERRGRPAAQRVYGNAAVILTGDVCVSKALALAAEEAGLQAVTRLAQTVAEMSEGEVTQLLNAGNLELDRSVYFDVVDKKSASLMAWCVAAGAWAIENERKATALERFGRHVGTAFQITDDVLDCTGNVATTGKKRGRDLEQRKLTLPLLLTVEKDARVGKWLQEPMAPENVNRILSAVETSGSASEALLLAREHVAEGIASLAVLEDSEAKSALMHLAHHLVERVS